MAILVGRSERGNFYKQNFDLGFGKTERDSESWFTGHTINLTFSTPQ
jgi:hypothetical protein